MKILIDMTHITMSKIHASTSIYIFRILDTLYKNNKSHVLLIHTDLKDYVKNKYPGVDYIIFPHTSDHVQRRKKGLSKFIFQAIQYRKYAKLSQCDGILIANDLHLYTCIPTSLKKIVVIHDLKALKDNSIIGKIIYYIFYFILILSSFKTIAISNFTKQDILKHFGNFLDKKIEVVYNSIQLSCKSTRPLSIPIKLQYILHINTLLEYKNIKTLIEAMSITPNINHKLIVVGKATSYWNNSVIPFIKKKNLTNKIIHLPNVTDEELRYLYENASLFVSCSTREGFGYTPIEAAICKCPVISSTCEALPETTHNMLTYYSPVYDAKELNIKMIEILSNPPTLSQLKKISDFFSNLYTPEKQTTKIFSLFYDSNTE